MSAAALFLNDRDVETDFSFYVSTLAGWPGNLARAPRTVPLLTGPEMSGAIVDPRLITRSAATATASGMVLTANETDARDTLDRLRELLNVGEVAVRTLYAPDRQCLAICSGFDGSAHVPEVLDGDVNLSLTFVVPSGVAERRAPDGYALSTSAVACPTGTAESYPVIVVHGNGSSLTNPVLQIRNAGGVVVMAMGFTVVLGSTAALRIDCARASASIITAGVVSDALAAGYWTSGDFPVLRPYDATVADARYPTIELSVSGGTPVGCITYTRRYV